MKFFNLDLHISVIADIKSILEQLGHSVTDWTLSGHAWVFGRQPDPVDVINASNWEQIGPEMADRFYERYKDELSQYDAFIVTHTPCFAMLYERFEKPVIVVASTRYEHPFHDAGRWQAFNEYLRSRIDSGRIIPLVLDPYDGEYAELFTKRRWDFIPSLCEYTSAHYTGKRPEFLLSSKLQGIRPIRNLIPKEKVLRRGYTWQEVADYQGVVHIPYNNASMSLFEQYTANIPLFYPSLDFLRELYTRHASDGVLSEITWNQVKDLPPGSAVPVANDRDPNQYTDVDTVMHWIRKAGSYNGESLPYITYFDSFEHLEHLLQTCDLRWISQQMRDVNAVRRKLVFNKWESVVQRIVASEKKAQIPS